MSLEAALSRNPLEVKAATKIQAQYRGWKVRKCLNFNGPGAPGAAAQPGSARLDALESAAAQSSRTPEERAGDQPLYGQSDERRKRFEEFRRQHEIRLRQLRQEAIKTEQAPVVSEFQVRQAKRDDAARRIQRAWKEHRRRHGRPVGGLAALGTLGFQRAHADPKAAAFLDRLMGSGRGAEAAGGSTPSKRRGAGGEDAAPAAARPRLEGAEAILEEIDAKSSGMISAGRVPLESEELREVEDRLEDLLTYYRDTRADQARFKERRDTTSLRLKKSLRQALDHPKSLDEIPEGIRPHELGLPPDGTHFLEAARQAHQAALAEHTGEQMVRWWKYQGLGSGASAAGAASTSSVPDWPGMSAEDARLLKAADAKLAAYRAQWSEEARRALRNADRSLNTSKTAVSEGTNLLGLSFGHKGPGGGAGPNRALTTLLVGARGGGKGGPAAALERSSSFSGTRQGAASGGLEPLQRQGSRDGNHLTAALGPMAPSPPAAATRSGPRRFGSGAATPDLGPSSYTGLTAGALGASSPSPYSQPPPLTAPLTFSSSSSPASTPSASGRRLSGSLHGFPSALPLPSGALPPAAAQSPRHGSVSTDLSPSGSFSSRTSQQFNLAAVTLGHRDEGTPLQTAGSSGTFGDAQLQGSAPKPPRGANDTFSGLASGPGGWSVIQKERNDM